MSSIFTVHRQPYGEVINPISADGVRFHDKNGNVTEVSMVDGMVNIRVGGVTVSAEHLEDLMRQMFGRGEHPPAEAHCATCDDGDEADADLLATLERARTAEARAERLAEALRDIESRPWNGVRPIQIASRAALRDHDKEMKDG